MSQFILQFVTYFSSLCLFELIKGHFDMGTYSSCERYRKLNDKCEWQGEVVLIIVVSPFSLNEFHTCMSLLSLLV